MRSRTFSNAEDLPTVFFADNDFLAVSSIQAITRLGYSVPDDISIVGFDDLDICTLLKPHLTTSKVDFGAMARAAIRHLMNLIEGSGASRNKAYRNNRICRDGIL